MASQDAHAYAWNWFSLHSGQRLQLVNFWLVAVAFLAGAFVEARSNDMFAIASGIAAAGCVASLTFLKLDVRTRQLVRVAEVALLEIEAAMIAGGADESIALVRHSDGSGRSRLDSYRVLIQGLQLVVAVLFAAGGLYNLAQG